MYVDQGSQQLACQFILFSPFANLIATTKHVTQIRVNYFLI